MLYGSNSKNIKYKTTRNVSVVLFDYFLFFRISGTKFLQCVFSVNKNYQRVNLIGQRFQLLKWMNSQWQTLSNLKEISCVN